MMAARRTRTTTRVEVSSDRGVFMISVAAELAEMHPQTLRMYEARGLIEPKRSAKGTRLYSQADVERLRRIQEMTAELGMNLAGVERVFELELRAEIIPYVRGGELVRKADIEQVQIRVRRPGT
jgi:MerR family transcriptional regulator/heat shock protein HspR